MFRKQPKIDVKPTSKDKKIIQIGWLLVAMNFILVFAFYFKLPDTIPTHFNLKGEADGFRSRSTLWILPIINLFSCLLMSTIATKMKPWNYNYPIKVTENNAPRLYAMSIQIIVWLNFGTTFIFLVITLEIILKAIQYNGFRLGWTFISLFIIVTLVPFWYIFKMFKIPKE